jgi:hypothetical protein
MNGYDLMVAKHCSWPQLAKKPAVKSGPYQGRAVFGCFLLGALYFGCGYFGTTVQSAGYSRC